MKISATHQDWNTLESNGIILLLSEDQIPTQDHIALLDRMLGGLPGQMWASGELKGERGESVVLFRPTGLDVERLVLAGAGPLSEIDFGSVRAAVHTALGRLKGVTLDRLTVLAPSWLPPYDSVQAVSEGIVLSSFTPAEYRTDRKEIRIGEAVIAVSEGSNMENLEESVHRGQVLSQATNLARWLTNEPGNQVHPLSFTAHAEKLAQECRLEMTVMDEADLEKRGMNAVLAVAGGSFHPARFIVLKHQGASDSNEPPIALVGKGVTFDSGGISLKPAKSMEEMKADKAGACSVLAAMKAISELQIETNVVAVLPIVENLPGGKAQRPGDVVKSMSGKTIEVINTDAEGRLILADALSYAREEIRPRCMVDIATLTGACVVALGHLRAGLFGNDEEFTEEVLKASEKCGERLWRLPLDREYRKDIESQIADIRNVGNRWGGAIVAAKFLQEFVGDTPWCHIDMAGVDLFHEKNSIEGPTGFGVRTLVEVAVACKSG
jgi:leucyl aminopeptidase